MALSSVTSGGVAREIGINPGAHGGGRRQNVHDDVLAVRAPTSTFNRGGVPLVEIVSRPEIHSGPRPRPT